MSPWVRTIFLEWLPWLLLMNRPGKQFRKPKRKRRPRQQSQRREAQQLEMLLVGQQRPIDVRQRIFPAPLARASESSASRTSRQQSGMSGRQLALEPAEKQLQVDAGRRMLEERFDSMVDLGTAELLRSTLRELSDYLHLSTTKWDEEEEEEEQKADWRFMAMSVPNSSNAIPPMPIPGPWTVPASSSTPSSAALCHFGSSPPRPHRRCPRGWHRLSWTGMPSADS